MAEITSFATFVLSDSVEPSGQLIAHHKHPIKLRRQPFGEGLNGNVAYDVTDARGWFRSGSQGRLLKVTAVLILAPRILFAPPEEFCGRLDCRRLVCTAGTNDCGPDNRRFRP